MALLGSHLPICETTQKAYGRRSNFKIAYGRGDLNQWLINKPRERHSVYATYDAKRDRWEPWKRLWLPEADREFFFHNGAGCVQRYDLPDGDILLPVYMFPPGSPNANTFVFRCTFNGETLKYVDRGNELRVDEGRGMKALADEVRRRVLPFASQMTSVVMSPAAETACTSSNPSPGRSMTGRNSATTTRSSTGSRTRGGLFLASTAAARTMITCSATARRCSWRWSIRSGWWSYARPSEAWPRSAAPAWGTSASLTSRRKNLGHRRRIHAKHPGTSGELTADGSLYGTKVKWGGRMSWWAVW